MNRGDLIASVKGYLNRPDLPASEVALWVPVVEGQLNRALRTHPRSIRRATFTLPGGSPTLPVPTNIMQLLTLRTEEAVWRQYPFDARELAEAAGTAYILRGDSIELYPVPDVETVFTMDYHAALDPLSDDSDENWVSRYFADIYLYGLLKEGAMYLKDDARFNLWGAEFGRRVKDLLQQGWDQNVATSPQVRNGGYLAR